MGEDLARIRAESLAQGGRRPNVPSRRDLWRKDNPDEMSWWTTKNGGYVVQFWGMKVYYGSCKGCGEFVGALRSADTLGRWPETCTPCQERKQLEHDNGARGRMRKARAKYGPVRDLRQFNGAHHHKDDDEFGIPSVAEDVDHFDPRHRSTVAKANSHQRNAPEDFPRGTTGGRR